MIYIKLCLLILASLPAVTLAQNNLVNLPIGETASFNEYINAIYIMFISIAALIAVVKIIIAGVKYMFTDIVTQKGEAKKDIQSALLGLLVVMSAVLVLTVINPDLISFNPDINQIEGQAPPDNVNAVITQRAIDTCNNSSVCSVSNCNTDCEEEIEACQASKKVVKRLANDVISCFSVGLDSPVAQESDSGNELVNNYLSNSNEYNEVVTIYSINQRDQINNVDLTLPELQTKIEEWAEVCEVDQNGNETGNTYEEIESNDGVIVRVCLN